MPEMGMFMPNMGIMRPKHQMPSPAARDESLANALFTGTQ